MCLLLRANKVSRQQVSGQTTCQIPDIENSCSRDSSRKTPPSVGRARFSSPKTRLLPLTLGNVGGSPTPGNHTAETGLAGWGARIRTWEWRNQNPQEAFDMLRKRPLICKGFPVSCCICVALGKECATCLPQSSV